MAPISHGLPASASSTPNDVAPRFHWSERICSAWQKSVEAILQSGRLLIDAKADLAHGEFQIMVRDQLPFSSRTAQQLMQIARNPQLANTQHVAVLPAAWGTLAELSRLDDEELNVAFEKRLIKPDLERKDVPGVRAQVRRALSRPVTERAKTTVVRGSFIAAMIAKAPPELLALLDSFPQEINAEIAGALIDMLISLLVTNSVGEGVAMSTLVGGARE